MAGQAPSSDHRTPFARHWSGLLAQGSGTKPDNHWNRAYLDADHGRYIVPSAGLIVLRTGDNPPKSPEWENTILPKTLLRGLRYRGAPQQ